MKPSSLIALICFGPLVSALLPSGSNCTDGACEEVIEDATDMETSLLHAKTEDAHNSKHGTRKIYIVRHGERAGNGFAQLNECGWDRAYQLQSLFGTKDFAAPKAVYAFNYHHSDWPTSRQRARETVSLVAKKFVKQDPTFLHCCEKDSTKPKTSKQCDPKAVKGYRTHMSEASCAQDQQMAQKLHKRIQEVDTILVGWEHENIQWLVYYLNAQKSYSKMNDVLAWANDMFDYVVVIHYTKGKDGKYHHSDIELRRQNIDPLTKRRLKKQDFSKCPNCKNDGSRRRQGCPTKNFKSLSFGPGVPFLGYNESTDVPALPETKTEVFRTSSTTQVPCTLTSGPTGSDASSAKDKVFHTTCSKEGDEKWSFSYNDVGGEVWASKGGDDFGGSYSSRGDKGNYEGSYTSNDMCTSYWGNWKNGNGESGFFALQIGDCDSAQVARTNSETFRTSSATHLRR